MNGNQGLEALAALCGGEVKALVDSGVTVHGDEEQEELANEGENEVPKDSSTSTATTTSSTITSSSLSTTTTTTAPLTQQSEGQSQLEALGKEKVASPVTSNPGATPVDSLTVQQWQQAVAAAAALGSSGANIANPGLAAQSQISLLPGRIHQTAVPDQTALVAMQQLAYYRYFQQLQANAAAQHVVAHHNNFSDSSNPIAMALSGKSLQQNIAENQVRHQVLPPATIGAQSSQTSSSATTSMPPPPSTQGGSSLQSTLNMATGSSSSNPSTTSHRHTAIAPLPDTSVTVSNVSAGDALSLNTVSSTSSGAGRMLQDKKLQKRAANRKSAQLSRKRKKQFIEELKEENDELRRKEQILRSIPDLIVVFDSAGKLWFVSKSVSRFIKVTAEELEGTSFWDRLCQESVRLLKAAFMDSLASRTDESETAPLGDGIWELRLVDLDGSFKVVTLNGVVHFSGERPECVCSIRPRNTTDQVQAGARKDSTGENHVSSVTAQDRKEEVGASTGGFHYEKLVKVMPHQSVIAGLSTDNASVGILKEKPQVASSNGKRREVARISDGESFSGGSGTSDSGD